MDAKCGDSTKVRKKRVILTILQKLEILKLLDHDIRDIAKNYYSIMQIWIAVKGLRTVNECMKHNRQILMPFYLNGFGKDDLKIYQLLVQYCVKKQRSYTVSEGISLGDKYLKVL